MPRTKKKAPAAARSVSASRARDEFSDLINRVAYGHETVLIHRRKKPVAAIIPVSDPAFLEWIEDELDARAVRQARREKGPNVPWEEVKKRMQL
jgi:prevent-host-death family protein